MREIKFRAWNGKKMLTDTNNVGVFNNEVFIALSSSDMAQVFDGIPMQFTGLIDKLGVEIYEGDVLDYSTEGSRWNMLVSIPDCYQWNYESAEYVVIGNIYQNPELLTS